MSVRFSVALGFRDWGLDRLAVSLGTLVGQVRALGGEVVVCDYGSRDERGIRAVIEEAGARCVRVDDARVWSRSRALNAALRECSGDLLVTTDADMLFGPNTFNAIVSSADSTPGGYMVLQCRDLPEIFSAEYFQAHQPDWDLLEGCSIYRPRYGMGGMIAFPRWAYLTVRGFDERMTVYGGEDIDFANRLQRAGLARNWLTCDDARMYHIWHPSSRRKAEESLTEKEAVAANSAILTDDLSYVRNLNWRFPPVDAAPLVSIVIATRNRSALVSESVYSCLTQTCRDIEVVVVDDGSTDDTQEVLGSIDDPRLRVVYQEPRGVAAARNHGTELARAEWIAVHDDDDIMLPTRIEDHFSALQGSDQGTYGGWIDFVDNNPEVVRVFPGKEFDPVGLRFNGRFLLHGTLTLRRELMQQVAYDETYRSGSDYNLMVAVARTGARLRHTGRVAMLRRLHDHQLTSSDGDYQEASWESTKLLGQFRCRPRRRSSCRLRAIRPKS